MDLTATAARQALQHQMAQYFSGSALVIYVYDYFLTLDREIEFVWMSRLSPVKNLFLLNRYFILVSIIIQQFLLGTINRKLDLSECRGLVQAFIVFTTFETFLSERLTGIVMLCIRLWVMWNKNNKVFAGTMFLFVVVTVYYITDAEKTFDLPWPDSIFAHPPKGCALMVQPHHAYVTFIILIASDIVKIVLALIPTLQIYKARYIFRNNLLNEVYREGVLFYVYLTAYTIVTLGLVIQSADNAVAVVPIFLVIRTILASRMVLHVRQLYRSPRESTQTTGWTLRSRSRSASESSIQQYNWPFPTAGFKRSPLPINNYELVYNWYPQPGVSQGGPQTVGIKICLSSGAYLTGWMELE